MERYLLSHCVGGREDLGDIVVSISDANVLGDVAFMDHICPSGRHFHDDFLVSILCSLVYQAHLFSTLSDFFDVEFKTKSSVD